MTRLLARLRDRRDEAGSMVIALSVMLILTNLSLALLARTLVNLHAVRIGQDFSSALSVADAGLSDALFQLDQGTVTTGSFQSTGMSGSNRWTYHATKNADDSYTVQSKGVVGGSTHAIQATVTRGLQFPFALFADKAMTFTGATPIITSVVNIGGAATGQSHVGSNTSITVNGGSPGDYQDVYNGASCGGCPNKIVHTNPSAWPMPAWTTPSSGTQSCPAGGIITGVVNGQGGVVGGATKPMVCATDVTITGAVTVQNPPFKLYVTADHALDMSTAAINVTGSAADFQIYKAGNGALSVGTGSDLVNVAFSGVLCAPDSTLTISGSKYYNGSIIVDQLDVQGTTTLKISFDSSLTALKGTDWQVSRYTEVPSSSLTF